VSATTQGEKLVLERSGSGELVDVGELPEEQRILSADLVRRLCVEGATSDPRGLRIKGASIRGRLDLSSCTLDHPLILLETRLSESPCFARCSLPHLVLRDCSLPGLGAEALQVRFDLDLRGTEAVGAIVLTGARIGGRLNCDGAAFVNEGQWTIVADGAEIGGNVLLSDGFSSRGAVVLLAAKLGGNLVCDRATLSNEGGWALLASGAEIRGGAAFRNGFSARGGIDLSQAKVGGALECTGATLASANEWALVAEAAEVGGTAILRDGFSAEGGVLLHGAKVKGNLELDGARLVRLAGEPALVAEGAEIGGSVLLRNGFTAVGGVVLHGARLGGNLECDGGMLVSTDEPALRADSAEIGGSVMLRNGFTARGWVVLLGATIDGNLECDGATIVNDGGRALTAEGLAIGGNVYLRQGFDATGEVRLFGARVGGNLECDQASFANPGGWALDANGADLAGALIFTRTTVRGGLNLFRMGCTTLIDDLGPDSELGSWAGPEPLRLEGFRYDRFGGDAAGWDSEARFSWLERTQSFDPGAWQRLRDVYRAQGRDADARRTAIATENDRLKRGDLSPLRWAGRWILRITIGHGYRSWLALVWAVAIVVPFALLVWQAPAGTFVPAASGAGQSPQPLVYSLDTFLPIVDLGEADQWTATGGLRWAAWTVILLGWALSTIFVAGFTRIVRSV
jgi:hypothetical protein